VLRLLFALAAIPLALIGVLILFALGWLLFPYAALFISGFVALVMFSKFEEGCARIAGVIAGASILWIENRWPAGRL
jgi:hypothetical protein